MTWIRKERDWLERAKQSGRTLETGRMLPVLPANVAGNGHAGNGRGDGHVHAGSDH
jgi:hypothetical protein